jgi:hypothetical protein
VGVGVSVRLSEKCAGRQRLVRWPAGMPADREQEMQLPYVSLIQRKSKSTALNKRTDRTQRRTDVGKILKSRGKSGGTADLVPNRHRRHAMPAACSRRCRLGCMPGRTSVDHPQPASKQEERPQRQLPVDTAGSI